jgi:hypothetical protein
MHAADAALNSSSWDQVETGQNIDWESDEGWH